MKNPYRKINRSRYSLGELVSIVGSCARDSRETLAALVDLFESGRVLVNSHGQLKRVRVASAASR
ncbi:MAG: hypothetical protein SFU53_12510 [Terrimicrobiaceae bacterium]|nr:hypothetical protein [Terrimicrobiaceae bacterium]